MSIDINYGTLATGALGFTIALAWNDAISSLIRGFYRPRHPENVPKLTFAYAVVVTMVVIFIAVLVNRAHRVIDGMRDAPTRAPVEAAHRGPHPPGGPAGPIVTFRRQ